MLYIKSISNFTQ
ncbi:hypothetical protein Zm00014a_041101 [Zea mays]|uniref:Uncharacterized protein n=1 Tax=Zea mays TaxID=4577 RepID=A0A3L6DB30_MAIZE|nr:hypothetical protein Zm00014a_041101 [Zea mays]